MTEICPEKRLVGNVRVSTVGQILATQPEQLHCGVIGTRADQRELLKMLKALAPGDVVTGTRIDRLARSTFDLSAIVRHIVDANAQFRSLPEPWVGTSTGRLMIAVLGGLADVERDLIRTRTAEGCARAQKRGQPMGRRPRLTPEQQERGPAAACGRGYPQRTGEDLQCQASDDFPASGVTRSLGAHD
jgi:DNA invertase Pin-like site-specific DNA recombinase